jgi:hypothetical protein
MELGTPTLQILSGLLLAFGVWWFLRRNDELPLAITGFNFLFLRRLWLVESGVIDWARFDYGIPFSFGEYSHEAATYMLLGATILTATYCMFAKRRPGLAIDNEDSFKAFLLRHRSKILAGFVLFSIANGIVRPSFSDHLEDLFVSGYAFEFTLAHSSFIILIAILVMYAQRGTLAQKALMLAIVGGSAFFSIMPSLRFAILGWAVPLAFVTSSTLRASRKLLIFSVVGSVVALVFTVAGMLRYTEMQSLEPEQLVEASAGALMRGGDVNMLDGFTMLMQVYPDVLDYGLGREHLDILTRPIPRSLWPGKPVGSWTQKLAVASGTDLYGTGISPSLYGSFYGEGGVLGVILLSAAYGWLFARYVNWANRFGSTLRWMLRGVLVASLFALMRGGDLPGIAAFIGMSYWPLALFVWTYRRELRRARPRGALRFSIPLEATLSRKT